MKKLYIYRAKNKQTKLPVTINKPESAFQKINDSPRWPTWVIRLFGVEYRNVKFIIYTPNQYNQAIKIKSNSVSLMKTIIHRIHCHLLQVKCLFLGVPIWTEQQSWAHKWWPWSWKVQTPFHGQLKQKQHKASINAN